MTQEYDFTRCVRPNGTAYGTSGQCRKGVEEEKKAIDQLLNLLPKGEVVIDSRGREVSKLSGKPKASEEELYDLMDKELKIELSLSREMSRLRKMSEAKKFDPIREKRKNRIDRIEKALKKIKTRRETVNSQLEAEAARSGIPRPLIAPNWKPLR